VTRGELLSALADRICAIRHKSPLLVAVDGVDAAGKTMLADELSAELRARGRDVIRASIDGFHNARAIRHGRGPESPDGYYRDSFNYPALVDNLLSPLAPLGTRRFRKAVFEFRADTAVAAPTETARDDAILLFDGVFLARPEIRAHWDYRIFVAASFDTTIARAMRRDLDLFGSPDAVRRRYEGRYVPGQKLYLAECDPESSADAVVENDDPEAPLLRDRRPGRMHQAGTRLDATKRIPVLEPLRKVNSALLDLLSGFSDEDWTRPTIHPDRNVKDLTAHLLHGSLRRVTAMRDRYRGPTPPIHGSADLVAFIQADNREFMSGMRRVSPQI
jgi:uridine kinase